MARNKLRQVGYDVRERYVATVGRFGYNPDYELRTILLTNVKLESSEEIVTNHLWFTLVSDIGLRLHGYLHHIVYTDVLQFDFVARMWQNSGKDVVIIWQNLNLNLTLLIRLLITFLK